MQTTTKKVKATTKGRKQIVTENEGTLSFYRNMVFAANAIYFVTMLLVSTFKPVDIFFIVFSLISYVAAYRFMAHMSKAKYSDSGQLIDSGVDLNMEGGIAEQVKDLIILTASCQVLSLYSYYFWLLWLHAPLQGIWFLWKNFLKPYLNQRDESLVDGGDKKQKQKKKKMKYYKMD